METQEKITALVTGAAGFTGQHMVEYLLTRTNPKYEVIGTDLRKPTDPNYPPIDFLEKNLTQPKELLADDFQQVLKRCEIIYAIGGLFDYSASLQKLMHVNVDGTRNFLNAVLKSGNRLLRRLMGWGAGGIFGTFEHLASLPATENMEPKTDNPYLVSKCEQEREILNYGEDYGIPVTVIRPSAVYGARSVYGMALSILSIGKGILPPMTVGSGKNHGALVHVHDVVAAAEFLSRQEKAIGEVYQVTDDGKYTIEDITKCIAREFGLPFISWMKIPPKLLYQIMNWANAKSKELGVKTVLDPQLIDLIVTNSWLSNQKLKDLGFEFTYGDSLKGLKEAIAAYKKARWV